MVIVYNYTFLSLGYRQSLPIFDPITNEGGFLRYPYETYPGVRSHVCPLFVMINAASKLKTHRTATKNRFADIPNLSQHVDADDIRRSLCLIETLSDLFDANEDTVRNWMNTKKVHSLYEDSDFDTRSKRNTRSRTSSGGTGSQRSSGHGRRAKDNDHSHNTDNVVGQHAQLLDVLSSGNESMYPVGMHDHSFVESKPAGTPPFAPGKHSRTPSDDSDAVPPKKRANNGTSPRPVSVPSFCSSSSSDSDSDFVDDMHCALAPESLDQDQGIISVPTFRAAYS